MQGGLLLVPFQRNETPAESSTILIGEEENNLAVDTGVHSHKYEESASLAQRYNVRRSTDARLMQVHYRRNTRRSRAASSTAAARADGLGHFHSRASELSEETRPTSEEVLTGWARCADEVWKLEDKRVEQWKEDINYLLLYAGLFSATVTGFIVPFYGFQSQSPDTTAQALVLVAHQLSIITVSLGRDDLIQELPAAVIQIPTQTVQSTALTGTLWTIALILSLSAGATAIFVGQWLHHHTNRDASLTRQSVRLWYFRHRGFKKWRVETIINLLPFLLQTALVLFLVGLVEQLWYWNYTVAGTATGFVAAAVAASVATTIVPAFAPACPFKSPQAWWWFRAVRFVRGILILALRLVIACIRRSASRRDVFHTHLADKAHDFLRRLSGTQNEWLQLSRWTDFDNRSVRLPEKEEDEHAMLADADEAVTVASFIELVVRPCLQIEHIESALKTYYIIVQHHAHGVDRSKNPPCPNWYQNEQDGQTVLALGELSVDMLSRISPRVLRDKAAREEHCKRIYAILENLFMAIPGSGSAVYTRLHGLLPAPDVAQEVGDAAAALMWSFARVFQLDVGNTLNILSSANIHLGTEAYFQITCATLHQCRKLPRADLRQIRDDLRVALRRISISLSSSDVECDWRWVTRLLYACFDLARVDNELFTRDVIEGLARCASRCPEREKQKPRIQKYMNHLFDLSAGQQ